MQLGQLKIVEEIEFKNRNLIHANVPNEMIAPIIISVQDLHVHRILGDALYLKIKTDIQNNSLAGNYLSFVNDYLKDAIVYGVMSDYVIESTYQNYAKGLTKKRDDFAESISLDDIKQIADRYENKRDVYIERAVRYLNKNIGLFPEYQSDNDIVNASTNTYSTSIFLRDEKKCGC
jgi:hypothetical protein